MLVLKEIDRVKGFDACQYRETTLIRRLGLRLSATKSKNYQDYLKVLKQNPSEIDTFIQTLTINVTDFFRDNDTYQILKKEILPELIQKAAATKRKRILSWSLASSRGQEPYSLAMLFHSVLGEKIKDFDIRILATDLDGVALEKAKCGVYTASDVKNVPRSLLNQYFMRKKGEYEVKPSLKDLIRFRQLDVIKSTPAGKFDLVLCRNIFIFFQRELQMKIIEKIHSALKRDSILVLGKAEALCDDNLFHTLFARHRIYQKKN
jgi:chemotaxis protein methyltransferase CheR